jgi:hypothetical protein
VDTSTYASTPSLKSKQERTAISWRQGGMLGKVNTRSAMMRDYTTSASPKGPGKGGQKEFRHRIPRIAASARTGWSGVATVQCQAAHSPMAALVTGTSHATAQWR